MLTRVFLPGAIALSLCAQVSPPGPIPPIQPQFPTALRLFLELNDTQVEAITQANLEFQRAVQQRSRRIAQVQSEIAEESGRDPIDPMALGVRYAEIESIRRFLEGEQGRMRERVRAVLTEPQRARLRTLEDITKLLPLYSEAAGVNLIAPVQPFARFTIGGGGIFAPPIIQNPLP